MKYRLPALLMVLFFASCNRNNDEQPVCQITNNYSYGYYGVRFPNAFTPNNDNRNDVYRPVFSSSGPQQISSFSYTITDKDGTTLFQSSGVGGPAWDGKNTAGVAMPPGRYVARFSLRSTYGETTSDNVCIALLSYGGGNCIPVSADGPYTFEDMYDQYGNFNSSTSENICP